MDSQDWTDRQVRRERKTERAAAILMIGWLLFSTSVAVYALLAVLDA